MDWHLLIDTDVKDVAEAEAGTFRRIGLIPEIKSRYRTSNFSHNIGGYAAATVVILGPQFSIRMLSRFFKETSLFNQELGASFRKSTLSRGGVEDPIEQFKKFRGREPGVEKLLAKQGLN
jgi:peptidyl-dipeptidase Dcp